MKRNLIGAIGLLASLITIGTFVSGTSNWRELWNKAQPQHYHETETRNDVAGHKLQTVNPGPDRESSLQLDRNSSLSTNFNNLKADWRTARAGLRHGLLSPFFTLALIPPAKGSETAWYVYMPCVVFAAIVSSSGIWLLSLFLFGLAEEHQDDVGVLATSLLYFISCAVLIAAPLSLAGTIIACLIQVFR